MSLKKYSAFAAGIALTCMLQGNALAATDVYVEGVYDKSGENVSIEIYADSETALISGGVAIEFDESQIVVPTQAEIEDPTDPKATKGPDWKIGNAEYMHPKVTKNGSKGKVAYILGKFDPEETTQSGVQGNRILLGKGKFKIAAGYNPDGKGVNAFSTVGLGFAYGRTTTATSEGEYVHFASPAGADIDGEVNFTSVKIRMRGDANGDGIITGNDKGFLFDMIQEKIPAPCFADANGDGNITGNDVGFINDFIKAGY